MHGNGNFPDYYTPEYKMVWRGDGVALKKALENGFDPNQSPLDNPASTVPLVMHVAAQRGFIGIIRLLRKHGAFMDPMDADGNTPLMYAMSTKAGQRAVPYMLDPVDGRPSDPNFMNYFGYTALFVAARENLTKLVRVLLEAGAQKNISTHLGETPRSVAIEYEIKKMLA